MWSLPNEPTQINILSNNFEGILLWLDLTGVAVFAISGALVASRKCLDPVGFALIAIVTGIGGGTLRDVLLGNDVFWVVQPHYVVLCAALSLLVYFIAPRIEYRYRVLLWADAAGLSLFCVLGARVAVDAGFSGIIAVVMGVLTATFGGLIRDVFCNEIPLILRNEIYAVAALAGSIIYIGLEAISMPDNFAEVGGILGCFLVRALALSLGLSLPGYRARAGREYPADDRPEF